MAREIVLDTETTGFEPHLGHRLVELACLEIEDYLPTGRSFHVYIDPERDMPPEAEKVHGLSAAFLAGKPKFRDKEIHADFLTFIGDAPIIAHNATFDRTFVNYELEVLGVPGIPEERWIDTLALELTTREMAAQAIAVARAAAYGARPRPLPFRSTEAERELHAQFVREVMKNDELWSKFGL